MIFCLDSERANSTDEQKKGASAKVTRQRSSPQEERRVIAGLTEDRPGHTPLAPFPPTRIRLLSTPDMNLVDVFRERRCVFKDLGAARVAARVDRRPSSSTDRGRRRVRPAVVRGGDDLWRVMDVCVVVLVWVRVDVRVRKEVVRVVDVRMRVGVGVVVMRAVVRVRVDVAVVVGVVVRLGVLGGGAEGDGVLG